MLTQALKTSYRQGWLLPAVLAIIAVLALVLSPGGAAAQGQEHEVEIRDFAFAPASLTVNVGDTVTWVNYDDVPHNASADDGTFQTEVVEGSADGTTSGSYTFTADDVGTHSYHCDVHPDMMGTIVVQGEPTGAPQTGAGGGSHNPGSAFTILAGLSAVAALALLGLRLARKGA